MVVTLTVAAIMAFPWSAGCETLSEIVSSMDKPTADVVGASLRDLTLEGAGLDFDVEVRNPYAAALPLVNLEYGIASSGTPLVSGAAPLSGTIPAGGSRVVTLPAHVTFADALAALGGVRPGAVVPYEADLTLSIDAPGVGPIGLPLSHAGELPIPAVPEIDVQHMTLGQVSLDEVAAVLRMRVRNTNQFRAALSSMDYRLALGGTPVAQSTVTRGLSLEPGASGELEIPLSFSPMRAGTAILGLLRGDEAGFEMTGSMALDTPFGAMTVPFDQRGVMPLRR
jgi:LEA14-like dessication related protein